LNVRYLTSHKATRAVLISVSLTLSQTPAYTARLWIRVSASHRMLAYILAFTGIHCTYP